MRDEGVGVDVACEPALDECRDAVASLDSPERRPGDAAAGDQIARNDVERLALACDARNGAEPPPHPCRLHGLSHHLDIPRRRKGVIGAEATGLLEDRPDRVWAAEQYPPRAISCDQTEPLV